MRARRLTRALLLAGSILAPGPPAAALDEPVAFSVIGDVPYAESELAKLQQHVANHNLYSPSDFLVHLGDIFGDTEACFEARYAAVADVFLDLAVPVYFVPGDNEWNDCADPALGWSWWTSHLMRLEQSYCGTSPTEYQAARLENFAFVAKGVLFVGINLVGGRVLSKSEASLRMRQDADWVEQQLQQNALHVRAAVVFSQAGPSSKRQAFFDRFVPAAAAFAKPVLFAQGDGHSWILDRPFAGAQNVQRMQVQRGTSPPVQVTATLDPQTPFAFVRSPWPAGAQPLNRPPCVEAGPDLVVPFGETALLDAFVTDDGDPPGTLAASWTRSGGPGAVSFADPQATSTTASFEAPGPYALRIDASDGQLSAGDALVVEVQSDQPLLTVDDLFVAEGETAAFTVQLLAANGSDVSVAWSTADATATAGADYVPGEGTLHFSGATSSRTVEVQLVEDESPEESETFSVRLASPLGAQLAKPEGVAIVLDDDAPVASFALAVSVDGPGAVTLDPPGGAYPAGTAVTLRAEPAPGFAFLGWSGDLSGAANPATLAMDADRAVAAHFGTPPVQTFALGVTAVGSGSVTLDPPGGVYESGTLVTLTAHPGPGAAFVGWSGALSGAANPAALVVDSDRSVVASFETLAGVALQEVAAGSASLSFVVATSASLSPASGDLYLAAVAFKPNASVTGVSGLGLAWTPVASQCAGRGQTGVSLWKAQGAPAAGGPVAATFATAPVNAVIAVARYSGASLANAIGSVVSANSLGVAGACQGGVDGAAYALDLATGAPGSVVFGAAAMRTRTHAPGAGFTERAELRTGSGGDTASLAVQDASAPSASTVPVAGSFSGSTDWAALAVEIRAATGAPSP
jgi:hypothetical protein